MKKIASFRVNHNVLEPGVYVSRVDYDPVGNNPVTTFDIRMTAPNREPVMDTAAVHALEHLGASYLRNDPTWGSRVVYFGPMGCRTGFYLVVFGKFEPCDIIGLLTELFSHIVCHKGMVPGSIAQECGNWHDSDLTMAKWWAQRFLRNTLRAIDDEHMHYHE
jgi:S-ribosylhomocysteine lyase